MLPVLLVILTSFVGCAAFKRPLVHPLVDDFKLVNQGEVITAPKQGAFVSNYFICDVMAIDVGSSEYCKGVK